MPARLPVDRTIATLMTTITESGLYKLMTWLSPAYPLGAFGYSHGIEYAVEAGLVRDAAGLQDYVRSAVIAGAGRSDAALFVAAWRAVLAGDEERLDGIAERAAAWRGSAETARESAAQGAAFLATTRAAWPHPTLDALAVRRNHAVALPVAVAVACAAHGMAVAPALAAYLHAFAANLVSAGVRLIPLGQTDGQRVIAALESAVGAVVASAQATPLDETGTAAPLLDWCSMRHETQYTRLFRS
jgi:urease accessory protein